MSGSVYDIKTGAWEGSADMMTVMELFGMDGLDLSISNALLGKLDSHEIFYAGDSKQGKVYLKGGDAGIEGKTSRIENGKIITYDGMCTVSFGN